MNALDWMYGEASIAQDGVICWEGAGWGSLGDMEKCL